MKRKKVFTAICLMTGLLLAGCSKDEMTDGNTLPEGQYPLEIASVAVSVESSERPWSDNAPQTRVVENTTDGNSSAWEVGDKIKVQIGDGTPGTYTYQDGSLAVAEGDTPAYWTSKAEGQTIKAWYTSSGNETVDLSDQTNGLAYVVTAQTTANFNQPVSLTFSHALAKVRMELTGEIASLVNNVSIKSYTTCTLTQGALANGENEGEIRMHKVSDKIFEANVYAEHQITRFRMDNGEWNTLTAAVTPEAEKKHKIGINVTGGQKIDLSKQGDVYTTSDKYIIIDGGGSVLTKKIVINEGASVMLKNVKLKDSSDNIKVEGDATLLLSGTNEVTNSSCPLIVSSGTLTINGTNEDQLKLISAGGPGKRCLSLLSGANLIINGGHITADGSNTDHAGIGSCVSDGGFITINGGKVDAKGGNASAGIGTNQNNRCGDITITGGEITATGGNGWGGAGIGSAAGGHCGNITISGKNTKVTATAGNPVNGSDDIGAGSIGGTCGTVTIIDATVIATNGRIHGH